MTSLRTRLLAFLLMLATAAAIVVATITYRTVLHETDQLFDYQLQQMALSLRDHGLIIDEDRVALPDAAFDYVVQVWSGDGSVTYESRPLPGLPRQAVLGYADVNIDGAPWRVFSATARNRVIQVAQPMSVRQRLAAAAAWRSVVPLLISAPLVAFAVGWLVRYSLSPLHHLVTAVRARDAESLSPLAVAGLPAEIAPLVAALNSLLARLAASFDAQRAFVADAAHELRSPLTALKLQLDLLRRAPDAATRGQAIEQLGSGMERMRHLVEQLMALARAEPGGADAAFADTDLAECARQAAADAVVLAQSRAVELELDAPQPVTVRGDANALRMAARNLIDNAVRYAGERAQVIVRVRADGGAAVLQVDDSGPGIPAEERARVFDRFYRRDSGETTGSGLGLAIVQAIAARHNAQVRLDDAPLGGLRAEVRFARREASA